MKKLKLILISTAIVVGIGGAFASGSQNQMCPYYTQYRYTMGSYTAILGENGVNWACIGGVGTCTYYKPSPSSPYLPCKTGYFYPIYNLDGKNDIKAK